MNERTHEFEANEAFATYLRQTYVPRFEDAIRERLRIAVSGSDKLALHEDLETLVAQLSSADIRRESATGSAVFQPIEGFNYQEDTYGDLFDVVIDLKQQKLVSNVTLSQIMSCSNRALVEFARSHPPVIMNLRRIKSIQARRKDYADGIARFVDLDAEQRRHLHTLPVLHESKYVMK